MKVLLDENLDHALRKLLGHHEVVTVAYMGWAGPKNGELLQTAELNEVDVLLTGAGTLTCEQNLYGRRIAIVALSAIQLPIIKQHLPEIIATLDAAEPGSFQTIDCGTFTRKNRRGFPTRQRDLFGRRCCDRFLVRYTLGLKAGAILKASLGTFLDRQDFPCAPCHIVCTYSAWRERQSQRPFWESRISV